MDMKKTAKKIAALVAGTTMLGATLMAASALDLSNYPAPFVTSGVFNGKIVVGAKAATSDVVGAIDLAASLQALATTTTQVAIPGAAGKASVTGDSAEFKTGSDVLAIGEAIGSAKQTFTDQDLKALKAGVLDTGAGSTPVRQYLKFDNVSASVLYGQDSNDNVADFLTFADGSNLFEYQMEFSEGATSAVDSDGTLSDFESEVVTILGAPYTIVDAKLTSTASKDITLSMLGGQVADVLRDGETKTYTIDGKDYEVTAVFISSDSPAKAKLSINGVMSKELEAGKTQVLGADVTVGIQSILTNQREGMVEFYLGASKLLFEDSDYTNGAYASETVKVGQDSVSDAELDIKATNQTGAELKLNYIKYRVTANDDFYVPAGHGLKEALGKDYKRDMLTDTWDITYAGLVQTGDSVIKFDAQADHSYNLDFTNVNGDAYVIPFVTNKNDVFKMGNKDNAFIFKEYNNGTTSASSLTSDLNTFISQKDYFIVSDRASSDSTDKAVTNVLRYQSLNTGDSTVTFKDLAGSDVVVSYSGTVGSTATGELIVAGASHDFYIGADSSNEKEKYALSMDLDSSGTFVNQTKVDAVAKGGAIIKFDNTTAVTYNGTGIEALGASLVTQIITPAAQFDTSGKSAEYSNVTISDSGTNTVSGAVSIAGTGGTTLTEDPNNSDYEHGYTDYGVWFERYVPSAGSVAPEVTIKYPLSQRSPQVFVTAGTIEVKEGTVNADGTLTTTTLNPIAVGLAVLDTDPIAAGTNIIVVGGPCVNAKAAELMGNPADCTAGFTPGKAIIKLFADKNALLVAGYGAQDTLGASYVLAQYKDYKLSGTEVEVVVADLNTITVNKVQ